MTKILLLGARFCQWAVIMTPMSNDKNCAGTRTWWQQWSGGSLTRSEMAAVLVPLSSGSVVLTLRIKYKGILGTLLTDDFSQTQCMSTWLWSFLGPRTLPEAVGELTLYHNHWISLIVQKYYSATISALMTPPIQGDFSLWQRSTQLVGPRYSVSRWHV